LSRILRRYDSLENHGALDIFAPAEGQGSFDEDFMRRLAAQGRGWYRRLNR
jgi:hypothetical protein